jgi:hypothetical protein
VKAGLLTARLHHLHRTLSRPILPVKFQNIIPHSGQACRDTLHATGNNALEASGFAVSFDRARPLIRGQGDSFYQER